MNETEYIAYQVVLKLQAEFPALEIQNHSANEFFDGFFTEFGFPADGSCFPIWDEPGQVIYIESPGIYWWNNDTFSFDASADPDEVPGMAILFLHEDGYLGVVDESDGRLFRLIKTQEPVVLAEYLKLFFRAGRERLESAGRTTPCLEGIEVPFFRFPDDYSEKSYEMPTVPISVLRDLIFKHVTEGRVWLCDFEPLDAMIRDTEERLEGKPVSYEAPESCLEIEGVSGWEWYMEMIKEENRQRSERRPALLKHGFAMDESLMRREAPGLLHSANWLLPYSYIDTQCGGDGVNLPICVLFNEGVFAPFLASSVDPGMREHVGRSASQFIGDSQSDCLALALPSYDKQVEATLIHRATLCQAPEVAKKIMQLGNQRQASGLERAEMRKAFIQYMRAWRP